jgi:Rieske Fe-S protein
MPDISRRSLLKILLGASITLTLVPLAALTKYLNIPYTFTPVKVEIQSATTMQNNSALNFQWPTQTRPFDSNILIRDPSGNYNAFNRVCTHLQCLVNYDPNSETIQCPCHGSQYDPHTGEVIAGPAPRALPVIDLEVDSDGSVYAVNAEGTFGYGRAPGATATTTTSSEASQQ